MKLHTVAALAALTTAALAQHTTPNTWTLLIGASQGWPQDTEGGAIHMIHVPPSCDHSTFAKTGLLLPLP